MVNHSTHKKGGKWDQCKTLYRPELYYFSDPVHRQLYLASHMVISASNRGNKDRKWVKMFIEGALGRSIYPSLSFYREMQELEADHQPD